MGVYLGSTLPDLLARKGWSQEKLATASSIARTDINRICRGRLAVGKDRLERIRNALGVTLLDLGVEEPGEAAVHVVGLRDRVSKLEARLTELQHELDELRCRQGDGL